MPAADPRRPTTDADDVTSLVGHPRGTLAIVLVFALLFAAGWIGLFLFRFMGQGAPHQH